MSQDNPARWQARAHRLQTLIASLIAASLAHQPRGTRRPLCPGHHTSRARVCAPTKRASICTHTEPPCCVTAASSRASTQASAATRWAAAARASWRGRCA
eukprot:4868387-Prymnesium_polylepis.2